MKILITTFIDTANLAIENIVKEMVARGHYIEIFAYFTDSKSIRMFIDLNIPIHHVRELNEKIIRKFDIAFAAESSMRVLLEADIYIFSYNNLPDTWISDGSDFMFTMVKDRKLRIEEDCATMVIGSAKNDVPKRSIDSGKNILYIDAGHHPFGEKGKYEVANMLLEICHKFPDYNFVVKPRWLLEDKNIVHRSIHIYNILNLITNDCIPDNLILLQEHKNLQELIDESVCVITTSYSCYLDAALRGKGCIVVDGFDSEESDIRIALHNSYMDARNSGCCVNYKDICDYLPNGIQCNQEHLQSRIPYYDGVSSRIVDVIEYIYSNYIIHGKYPGICNYDFESYKNVMSKIPGVSFQELKYKRFKNGALIHSRAFEHIKAKIDYSSYYELLEKSYHAYPLNETGFSELVKRMEEEKVRIYLENKEKFMTDAINQSILLQALYESGQENVIINMPQNVILCVGPYYYYLGMIYKNRKQTLDAIEHFCIFLKEANERSYAKYPQENDWGIRNAYNFIFDAYDGSNIDPVEFAYLYFSLYKRDPTIVAYGSRKRAHNFLPKIADRIMDSNPTLALECLQLYAKNEYHYNIRERDSQINTLKGDMQKSKLYCLEKNTKWFLKIIKAFIYSLWKNGWSYTFTQGSKKIRNFLKKKIENKGVYLIWNVFRDKVMGGYQLYSEVIQKYGNNARLFLSSQATGDTYIHGMCYESHIKKYTDIKPVFGVWEASGGKIADLFSIRNVEIFSLDELKQLYNLLMFDSRGKCKMEHMHFQVRYRHTACLLDVEGIHEFNYLFQSLAFLNIKSKQELTMPKFIYDNRFLKKIFEDYGLLPGKTVLLVPYAKCVRPIHRLFWNKLAQKLMECGFSVCTNTTGPAEPTITNTIGMLIPYQNSVPFLEMAGATVGLRSGFQDVTCTAKCLKITLYPENNYKRSLVWSSNESFNLTEMYHQPNQLDLIYSAENEEILIQEITDQIIAALAKQTKKQLASK